LTGELNINIDCADVGPASNKKKPLCSCQEVEEQILVMAKTAYLAIRRRDTTPASFEQFKKELSQTNEILRDSMEVMNTLKMLCEHGRTMNDISYGSIQFTMLCNSTEGARDLWEKYSKGHLLDSFQQGLVNKRLLKTCQAKWVKLRVKIAEEEYLQCLREIGMAKMQSNLREIGMAKIQSNLGEIGMAKIQNVLSNLREIGMAKIQSNLSEIGRAKIQSNLREIGRAKIQSNLREIGMAKIQSNLREIL
jgi:hypothetical protein